MDWRDRGGETTEKMPERVVVNDGEGLTRVSCGGEEEGVDVRTSGTGIDMDMGWRGCLGEGGAQKSQE